MAQYDINLREYWRILKKRRILVIVTAIALGVFSTFFAILRAPTPLYSSVCSIRFERQTPVDGLYARTISWSDNDDDMETQISVIKSYVVFQRVAEKLRLIPNKDITEDTPFQAKVIPIIQNLQSKVEVTRENFAYILNIKVSDSNPVFAQRLANTIALAYKELHAEQQLKRTTEALKYIDEQLKKMRQKLRESENEFNRFSQDNQLISIDMQTEGLLSRTREINNEIRKFHEDKKELERILERLNHFIKNPIGSDYDFYSPKAGSRYQTTNDTQMELMLRRDTLLEDYTSQHPEVVAISRKIMESARKMLILLKLHITNMENNGADLRKEQEKVERKTQVLMDKKLEFNRLKRKVELQNDMTALLEQKNQEALIRKAEKPEEITIVKPALLPATPINPPKTATTGAMGVVIGIVLGLVIAFIVETFDTSLGAIEDVEETLGLQVLGVIPHADDREIQGVLKDKHPEGIQEPSENHAGYLRSHFIPKSMVAESFRALRTNIQFKDTEKEIRTIAITSTSPQEGKTIVAINLAITMAQAGMKILLVGSDLRKPMLGKVVGIEATPGLTDILLGNYPWRDTVKSVTDIILGRMTLDEVMMTPGMDNLHIITSGAIPSNPAELIDSSLLLDFMEEAKEEYDLLLFDSPPVLSAADAAILGTKVDGVLLVYRLGNVSRGLLKRSSRQLEQINCHIMGVVLNGMRPEVSPDFHDYKYYRYYYSYGEEDENKKGRGHTKRFTFSRKKEEQYFSPEGKILPVGVGNDAQEKQGKKTNLLRLSLMAISLAVLALGILWHNGIVDPFKLLNVDRSVISDEIKGYVEKRLSSEPIPPSPPLATAWAEVDTPTSPIRILSDSTEGPGFETETPIPPSPPLATAWAEVDT
ncbi:MAG: AAA family ATPase, partial [Desulfatiglandales bacterium]